ncbi:MmgE/PrpD family protein [Pseudonocardia yuanmonensis]|uniref:MmgE/PrpD family protein n=1 Tax=Pseudonocardia yuanmonensis TaxID=1095914 RepID=A0ABP8VWJ4_9PSEU
MFLDDLTGQLAALASELSDEHLERAGICVLDALACVYGGRDMPWVAQARAVADAGGEGASAVWAAGGVRRGTADAVFVNAVGCHALLYEDTHAESRVHPGTVVVPVALGVGELVGASVVETLRAVVLGYEAIAQVAATSLTGDFVDRGWRASGVFGPFGAAAAAAYLFGVNPPTTVHALGMAASSAAGICEWAPAGTTEVYFQNASAARAGLTAVLLARAGATGAESAIEGAFGLRRAFGGLSEGPRATVKPDIRTDRLAVDRTFFKAHPSCALTQEAIDAARQLHDQGIDPSKVTSITIHTSAAAAGYPGCDNPSCLATPIARQMSLQFAVAAALVDGRLEPRRYTGPADPVLAGLAARSVVTVDPVFDEAFPDRRDARVELVLADGRSAAATSAERVDLVPADVLNKFRTRAGLALGRRGVDDVLDAFVRPGERGVRDLVARLT